MVMALVLKTSERKLSQVRSLYPPPEAGIIRCIGGVA